MIDKLWELLAPYIASEDVEYSESEMEHLCECVLPDVWSEIVQLETYCDKLAAGLPDGILPKDVEVLRDANAKMATEIQALRRLAYDYIQAYEKLAFGDEEAD